MTQQSFLAMLAMFVLSLGCLAGGILAYRGVWRKWLGWKRAGMGPVGLALLYVGIGGALFFSMAFFADLRGNAFTFAVQFLGGLFFALVGLGFAYWGMPRFLKPRWLRELEGSAPAGAPAPDGGAALSVRLTDRGLALLRDLPYGGVAHQLRRAAPADVQALEAAGLLDRAAGLSPAGVAFTAPMRGAAATVDVARSAAGGDAVLTFQLGRHGALRIEAVPDPRGGVAYDVGPVALTDIAGNIADYVGGARQWRLRSARQRYERAFTGWGDAERREAADVVERAARLAASR